jgi:hypothetical protein
VFFVGFSFVEERCVVSSGIFLFVGFEFITNSRESDVTCLVEFECIRFSWSWSVADSVNVVDVNPCSQVVECVQKIVAFGTNVTAVESTICKGTFVFMEFVVKYSVVETVPVTHFNVSGGGIKFPVGNSISNYISNKIWFEDIRISFIVLFVDINFIGKIWNIDSSV